MVQNILKERDLEAIIKEIVIDENFEKLDIERETYESLEELN